MPDEEGAGEGIPGKLGGVNTEGTQRNRLCRLAGLNGL